MRPHPNAPEHWDVCPYSSACDVETVIGSCFIRATEWLDQADVDIPETVFHWHLCRFHYDLATVPGAAPILDADPYPDAPGNLEVID